MNNTTPKYITPDIEDVEKYKVRVAYKTGNSIGIVLTGLLKEGTKYICWREGNDIILRET